MPTIQFSVTDEQLLEVEARYKAMRFNSIDHYVRFILFPPKWVQTPEQKASKLAERILWFISEHPGGRSKRDIAQFIGGKAKAPEIEAAICTLIGEESISVKREKRIKKSTNFYYPKK